MFVTFLLAALTLPAAQGFAVSSKPRVDSYLSYLADAKPEPAWQPSDKLQTAPATPQTAPAPVETRKPLLPLTPQLEGGIPGEVDEAQLLAQSSFTATPEQLLNRAKEVLVAGLGTEDGGECLAEDFEFVAAVVGPINKKQYLKALGGFNLKEAFPDLNPNYHLFNVDPFQPNRVYYHSRQTATHTGKLMGKKPTGKVLTLPPQVFHIDFNDDGKVKEVGFYTVDRRQGNTGGLGGAFGYFYGVGKPLPFPEAKPYKPSFKFRMFNFTSKILQRLRPTKKARKVSAGML